MPRPALTLATQRHELTITSTGPIKAKINSHWFMPPPGGTQVSIRPLRAVIPQQIENILSTPIRPFVPGTACIGRVHQAGANLPHLTEGQLVFVYPKDLKGYGMDDCSGTWATHVMVWFAESVHVLNEARLIQMGYSLDDLGYLGFLAMVYGNMRCLDIRPGDIVVVRETNSVFGHAAVHVVLALGGDVIIVEENAGEEGQPSKVLHNSMVIAHPASLVLWVDAKGWRCSPAIAAAAKQMGSMDGTVDVCLDMSQFRPNGEECYWREGVSSLRHGGRTMLMGGGGADSTVWEGTNMGKPVQFHYGGLSQSTTEQVQEMVKLVERGKLKLGRGMTGVECSGVFELREWKAAFEVASRDGATSYALFAPNGKDAK
jgi:NADPH:quinone reductase-like Zn-dependent oxidoreductase